MLQTEMRYHRSGLQVLRARETLKEHPGSASRLRDLHEARNMARIANSVFLMENHDKKAAQG